MQRTCANSWCQQSFEVTQDDLNFYDKISPVFHGNKVLIPPPKLCPECRLQRRFTWRNERNLYHRSCNRCDKPLLSNYREAAAPPVYCLDCWWGEGWSALRHGLSYRTDESFWRQFMSLSMAVPRPTLQILNSVNCDYTNFSRDGKDCYLCFSIVHCEECLYSTHTDESRSCVDCEGDEHCELCYECSNCIGCYGLTHSVRCENCRDSAFLYDCKDCHHCCLSGNLRGKSFVYDNQQLTQSAYMQKLKEAALHRETSHQRLEAEYQVMLRRALHHNIITHCERCTGDFLKDCKNCRECFDCFSGEDGVRCYRCPPTFRDTWDSYGAYGGSELCMEILNGKNLQRNIATIQCQDLQDAVYCIHCHSSSHLFGCIGLRHAQYCILNKQYTREEYERLVPQIIETMRADGEWGEFFPVSMSPFAYNETVAQEHFPLSEGAVKMNGWKWQEKKDEMPQVSRIIPAAQLPDSIDEIPDDILNWAIECEATKRPFKIIRQELEFYRKMRLPIPHFHPDERHHRRMALRNPRRLWSRTCMKCGKGIETTYALERPETVYCEDCYLKEVY